jgi:hypothetical protein
LTVNGFAGWLAADDLDQTFNDLIEFFRGRRTEFAAQAFGGQRANLADLDPGVFWQAR